MPHTSRFHGIDSGKLIAAFGVILIHIAPCDDAGEMLSSIFWVFSVSFFLVASISFFSANLAKKNISRVFNSLVNRILIPYAVWTFIYLSLFYAKDYVTGRERSSNALGTLVFGQSAVHLYFLPMLASIQMLIFSFSLTRSRPQHKLLAVLLAVLISAVWCTGFIRGYTGWRYMPVFPLFAVTGWQFGRYSMVLAKSNMACLLGVIVLTISIYLELHSTAPEFFGVPLSFVTGGIGFLLVALRLPKIAPTLISSTSYGIYLSHFLFLEGIELFLEQADLAPTAYSIAEKTTLACVVFSCSIAFTIIVRRSDILARLLLGERTRLSNATQISLSRHQNAPDFDGVH